MQRFMAVLACFSLLLVVCCGTANAQRPVGSPGPERIFGFMDRNRDGVLDREELQRMPGPMREFIARSGIDRSRPINQDTFMRMAPDMMDAMRRRRDADRERYQSSGDRDPRYGDPRYSDPRRESSRSGPFGGRDGGSSRDGDRRSRSDSRSKSKPKPRPRVTIALPEEFGEGDQDGDGQLGLYEWKKWKSRAALADFFRFDRNRDGFLTPRELIIAEKTPPVAETTASAGSTSSTSSGVGALSTMTVKPVNPNSTQKPATADSKEAIMARTYFRYMDRDGNGSINTEEWARSRRIRPMFERAGIDLSKPMSNEAFVQNYVRAAKAGKK